MKTIQEAFKNVEGMTSWGVRCKEDEDDIKQVEDFIEQHKPPTWEELVGEWNGLGYSTVNLSKQFNMVFLEGYGKNHLYISLAHGFESNDDVYVDIPLVMLEVIHHTIRYLESQKA